MRSKKPSKTAGAFDHKAFMLDPLMWPNWPALPVKRPTACNNLPECGVILAQDLTSAIPVVFICYLFDMPRTEAGLKALKYYKYESFDLLVTDGWLVD